MLSIKDNETDSEYIVQLSESEFDEFEFEDDDKLDDFNLDDFDFEGLGMSDIDMGIEDKGMLNRDSRKGMFGSKKRRKKIKEDEIAFEDDFNFEELEEELQDDGTPMPPESKEEMEENIYELELEEMMHDTTMESEMFPSEKMEGNMYEMDDLDEMETLEYEIEEKDCMEGDCNEEDVVLEGKKMFTGHGAGHVSFKGVNEDKPKKMKEGTKVPKNSGKPKSKGYNFESTVNMEGFTQKVQTKEGKVKLSSKKKEAKEGKNSKKKETKEASRTLGAGRS
jgi:hypothetical protein